MSTRQEESMPRLGPAAVGSAAVRSRIARSASALAAAALLLSACGGDSQEELSASEASEVPAALDGGEETGDPQSGEDDDAPLGAESPGAPEPTTDAETPAPVEDGEAAEGFDEVLDQLQDQEADIRALVVETDPDGQTDTLLALNAEEAAPVASVAKLYVLLALVEDIEAGDADWQDEITVTDELRSLPSGTLQDQADGYTTTVYDVARRMIQISDNTGTDMLIDHVGREAVEEALETGGHSEPGLMRPYLTTRELFQIRWGYPELGEEWAEAEEDERRDLLEEAAERDFEVGFEDTGLEDIDFPVDWYASAADIAGVFAALNAYAEDHSELETVLGSNSGLVSPEDIEEPWWETLAFKGGGLPGVRTGAWQAVDEDGTHRTVVVLAQSENGSGLAEEREEIFALAQQALIIGTTSDETDADTTESEEDAD